jgi:lipopolysaccharide cholinephosphotransferase
MSTAQTSPDPDDVHRRLQLVELEILAEIARRCDAEGLRWFVVGGTLLGAVRHGGFIPWDDDVDIGMPRPDYERFAALSRRSTDPRFTWQGPETEPAYPFIFGKLLRAGTRVEEPAVAHLPITQAVYVDIFPFDGAPASPALRRVHAAAYKFAVTAVGARIRRAGRKRLIAYAFRLVPRVVALALVRRLVRHAPYDRSPFAVNASGAWGYGRECQPRDRLEPTASLPFENMTVRVPGRWDEYLGQVYGDYRQLPPPEHRMPRHGFRILSLGAADERPGSGLDGAGVPGPTA